MVKRILCTLLLVVVTLSVGNVIINLSKKNYVTKEMWYYNEIEPYTFLIDEDGDGYSLKNVSINSARTLEVVVNTRGTERKDDDRIVSWKYKED